MPHISKWESLPTEAINPNSLALDTASIGDVVDLMVNEDRKVVAAVHREKERITAGVQMVTESFRKGGRVIFVGAGTSGRLGVVEAAEMPPTFGVSSTRVRAIMAGGKDAVFQPKEGVEDDYEEGARAIARLRPQKRDIVIGDLRQRRHAVRPWRADARAQGWPAHHLRDVLAGQRTPELRGPHHRARRRARSADGLDATEGRHRHQDGAQHAHHHRDGP